MRATCFSVVVALVFCELVSRVAVFCVQMDCQIVHLGESYQQFRVNETDCFTVSRNGDAQQAFLLDTEYSTDFNLTFIDANNSTFWQLPDPAIYKVPFNVLIIPSVEGNVTVHYALVKEHLDNFATFRIREVFGRPEFERHSLIWTAVEYLTLGVGQRKVVYSPNYPSDHRFHYLRSFYNVDPATENSFLQFTILKAGMPPINSLEISEPNSKVILWNNLLSQIGLLSSSNRLKGYHPSLVLRYSVEYYHPYSSGSYAILFECAEPSTTTRLPYISTYNNNYNKNKNNQKNSGSVDGSWFIRKLGRYFGVFIMALTLPVMCIFWICCKICSRKGSSRRKTGHISTAPVDDSNPVAHGVPVQVHQSAHAASRNTIEMQPTVPGSNSWPYSTTPSAPPQQSSARTDEPPSYWEAVNAP